MAREAKSSPAYHLRDTCVLRVLFRKKCEDALLARLADHLLPCWVVAKRIRHPKTVVVNADFGTDRLLRATAPVFPTTSFPMFPQHFHRPGLIPLREAVLGAVPDHPGEVVCVSEFRIREHLGILGRQFVILCPEVDI